MRQDSRTILFFDGVCNLCNGFIDFLISRDLEKRIFFAPLQGESAAKMVPDHAELMSSVVLYKDGKVFTESTAALLTLSELGGAWGLLRAFLVFPAWLRNPVYRLIARNRYRLFGKRMTCRVPTQTEKAQFLD